MHVKVFILKFDLIAKLLLFSNKNHDLQETLYRKTVVFFSVDYVKIIELHVVHT